AADGAVIPLGEAEEVVLGGPSHPISPAADSDPGIIGGPIESLVVMRGSSSAYGTAAPTQGGTTTTVAPPSRTGAHPGQGLTPPAVHRWDGSVAPATDGAAGDGSGGSKLRLWASRKLYSPGVAVTHSEAVASLAVSDVVRLHPDELDRLGMGSGAPLRVTSPRGAVTLPASADEGIPPGVAWMSAGVAADLVDAARATFVDVEVGVGG
ncbi:MAG TPA: molybdopterin dinucleotide binding domain-containing protein, partial [Acidimicrobiia bacterium]|nr:molybdopterin dinucleotide binding domain-containing protein [Acidimicrobiia bacterium]